MIPQEPPAEPGSPTPATAWFDQPAVVETALAVLVLTVFVVLWLRLRRFAAVARSRRALEDYLLGVELALSNDLHGARKRLARALDEDPENHYARLLFGRVLSALGEPAEAHKHHLYLQKGFRVESVRNDLALAENLLATGHTQEAAEAAQRARERDPTGHKTLEILQRTQLAAGRLCDAAETVYLRLALAPTGAGAAELKEQAVLLSCRSVEELIGRGAHGEARDLVRRARALGPRPPALAATEARLQAAATGTRETARALLRTPSEVRALPNLDAAFALVEATPHELPAALQVVARLLPAERWTCGRCGTPLPGAVELCTACHYQGAPVPSEPALFRGVESPSELMDALEENRAHVRRLLARVREVDLEAREELLEMGDRAVEELFAAAVQAADVDDPAIGILQEMGPRTVQALFTAYRNLRESRRSLVERFRRGDPTALLGRIVQNLGPEALPFFDALFDEADRDQRKVLTDYFIGLGDQEEFQKILDRFPPLEILHRLNRAEAEALTRFLSAVRRGSFLTEGLLLDPAFSRDEELFFALRDAPEPAVLIDVLARRNLGGGLAQVLVEQLDDASLGGSAAELLDRFGFQAVDHVLAAFADLDQPDTVRQALRDRLLRLGPAAVERLCATFGPAPSALDPEVVDILVSFGPGSVGALHVAYGAKGFLEKWSGGLVQRGTHRRGMIVGCLQLIGGDDARRALEELRATEKDQGLKLRLSQALHSVGDAGTGEGGTGHGQAG